MVPAQKEKERGGEFITALHSENFFFLGLASIDTPDDGFFVIFFLCFSLGIFFPIVLFFLAFSLVVFLTTGFLLYLLCFFVILYCCPFRFFLCYIRDL